jgi:hypothetical protein
VLAVLVAEVMEVEVTRWMPDCWMLLMLLSSALCPSQPLLLTTLDSWWPPTNRRGRNQHGSWRARRPAAQPRSPSNQPTYI